MASPDAGTQLKEGVAPAVAGSDEENADPTKGNLLKLWQQGTEGIATHRCGALETGPAIAPLHPQIGDRAAHGTWVVTSGAGV